MDQLTSTYLGNADFETRQKVQEVLANTAGFRFGKTFVPPGESLLPIGEENKRKMQADIKRLPDLVPGLRALREAIKSEQPMDAEVPVQRMLMSGSNAGLYEQGRDAKTALGYTRAGFAHIAQFIKPKAIVNGFTENMLALPVELRSSVFNHWAKNAFRNQAEEPVMLRTLKRNDRRIIRAVTSKIHSLETGDDSTIAAVLERSIMPGAKVRITRDMDRTDIEIIWPGMDREVKVGDVVVFALQIRNSETKAGCLEVLAKVLRIHCYNFTTVWYDVGESVAIKHIGDLKIKLVTAVMNAIKRIEPFIKAFGDAYQDEFPATLQTRGEVLARVQKVMGLPEGLLNTAAMLWDADGEGMNAGDTLAGLTNALTRAAQDESMDKAVLVEKAAGQLTVQGWDALAA